MPKEYSEDELVEKEAVKLLTEKFKYPFLNCFDEFKTGKSILGRNTKSEVVLTSRLKEALIKLNKELPLDAIDSAIEDLTSDRSRMSLLKANKEVYSLIKDGVKVKVKINNRQEVKTVKVIDFDNPTENDFLVITQLWIDGEVYQKRPDLIIFVNGLPLVLMEFKKTSVNLEKAYMDNITEYKEAIPQLFWYNFSIVLSNGLESKMGTITSGYEHFSEWKKINEEDKKPSTYLDKFLEIVCSPKTVLDLFENFTLFTIIENNKEIKVVAKNHQYNGVNNALKSFENREKNDGKLGVFWHTQGSGKSFSMIFFAQKILRKYEGNFTFVVVTDRDELDDQIYRNFQQSGVVSEENVQATSGSNLKTLLKENHRMIFTLIHKFNTEKGKKYEKISDRDDVIIMVDEAHRTQYDTLALNMRNALPNACFIGFTGTPLMKKGEEKTREVFGNYVSEYNFRDSVKDGATVPLYYENRVPELQLVNPTLTDEIYEVMDDADLTEQEREKVEKRLGSNYDIITREDRLNTIAEDIVTNFIGRGYQGKAMVISIDKFTAVRMFDKVKYHFNKKVEQLLQELRKVSPEDQDKIKEKIKYIKSLDMAVVLSQEQNEASKFKEKGLDIAVHRQRMQKEDLASNFKDSKNPLKLVFVCNMWITGFDVPSISTIYLDKPMKDHSLMQAIARANRVYGDKQGGFIVDYIDVFKNLRKALSVYASPKDGSSDLPIEAKEELVKTLEEYIKNLNSQLISWNVDLKKIINSKGKEKYPAIVEARSKLVINDTVKKEFLTKAGNAIKIYRAILPHKKASDFSQNIEVLRELVEGIYSLNPEINIKEVIKDIQEVLDLSISSKGYIIREEDRKSINLEGVDFDEIEKNLKKKKDYAPLENLKNILSFRLKEMIKSNNTRQDFQEKFEDLIKEYNSGSINAEKYLATLKKISGKLDEEQTRHIREGLTEEELALFDKLKKPNLSEKEIAQLKKVSKELLKKIYEKVTHVIDWRKKRQTLASAHKIIQDELDENLPSSYTPQDYEEKCLVVFQHVYDNYGNKE